MQKRVLKLFKYIFFVFLCYSVQADAQSLSGKLNIADSLFSARRYTQSLVLYKDIYNSGDASPAMLLKMAYSEEAQENLGKALVYLHDYYRFTSDEKVLDKMDELAQVNALVGYDESEFEKIEKVLHEFKYFIFLGLVIFSAIILLMMIRKFKKHQEKSLSLAVSLAFMLLLCAYVLNFTHESEKGIIMRNDSFIMSGPSAASELVEVVNQGHKIEVLGKKDIWVEIFWRGKRAFIRENNLEELL